MTTAWGIRLRGRGVVAAPGESVAWSLVTGRNVAPGQRWRKMVLAGVCEYAYVPLDSTQLAVDEREQQPMDLYSFCLMLGAVGLASMAFLGLGAHGGHSGQSQGHDVGGGHSGGHSGGHPGGNSGHDAGHDFGQAVGHADGGVVSVGHHTGHDVGAAHQHHAGGHVHVDSLASRVMYALISPRVIFSLLVGFGATGLVARQLLGSPFLLGAAITGALVFELAIVAPMWRFMMRFASNPALTLESAITDEVQAVTAFDGRGQGLVALEVDGQVAQILATLRMEDRTSGIHVRAGDTLRVESVDSARNQCTVSYISSNRQLR